MPKCKNVVDALARRQTLNEELDARSLYVAAEQQTFDIAMKHYQVVSVCRRLLVRRKY